MDHLHHLPTEILLQILQNCPDLSALFSPVNTSRRLSSIFEIHAPAKTFELVLEASVPGSVQRLMRMIIRIRAGVFKHHRWEDLSTLRLYYSTVGDLLTVPLLRRFLRLVHRVHVLAHLCLDRCWESLRCRAQSGKDLGAPSWTEEHRTIMSFWRVQYFYELKVARLKGRLSKGWETPMLSILGSASIDGGHFFAGGFQREQVLTVVEFIEVIKAKNEICDVGRLPCGSFRLPDPWDRKNADHSCRCENPSLGPRARRRLSGKVAWEATAWTYITNHARPPADEVATYTLQRLPFQPFRKLGLFLWDQKRLAELGLWPDPWRRSLDLDEGPRCFPAWLRLPTPDEVTQAGKNEDDDDW